MKLGSKFRKIRNLKGYSEEYVAYRIGISQNAYSRYELDKTQPTWKFIEQFAEVHEIDPIKVITFDEGFILNDEREKERKSYNPMLQEHADKLIEAKDETIRVLSEENSFLKTQLAMLLQFSDKKQV